MDTISFKRHRFPPEIIRRAVWLYARFTLSYRDVEDLLAERGLDISYEAYGEMARRLVGQLGGLFKVYSDCHSYRQNLLGQIFLSLLLRL